MNPPTRLREPALIALVAVVSFLFGFASGQRTVPLEQAATPPGSIPPKLPAFEHDDPGVAESAWDPMDRVALMERWKSAQLQPDLLGVLVAVHEILAQTEPEGFPLIFDRVNGLPPGSLKDAQIAALVDRWGSVDPVGAVRTLQSRPDSRYHQEIGRLHAIWSQQALEAAIKSAQGLADARMRQIALEQILRQQAAHDPAGALRLLADLPSHQLDPVRAHGDIFSTWARLDPQAAAEYAGHIRSSQYRREALAELAASWAASDPAKALHWAARLDRMPERAQALGRVLQVWAEEDPGAAAAGMDLLPTSSRAALDRLQVLEIVRHTARQLAQIDPEQALAWLEQTPFTGDASWTADVRQEAMVEVAAVMVRTDPGAALELIETIEGKDPGNRAQSFLSAWLQEDWEEAWDWIQALHKERPDRYGGWVSQAAWALARRDVAAAAEFAHTVHPAHQREFAERVGPMFVRVDPPGAFAWAQELALDEAASQHLLRSIARQWTTLDPESAEDHTQLNPQVIELFAAGLAESWAQHDLPKARAWFEHVPEGFDRRSAAGTLAREWVYRDIREAADWISQLPSGHERNAATVRLVEHIGEDHPGAAFLWADTLSKSDARTRYLSRLAERLRTGHSASIVEVIKQPGISSEAVALLQSAPPSAPDPPSR